MTNLVNLSSLSVAKEFNTLWKTSNQSISKVLVILTLILFLGFFEGFYLIFNSTKPANFDLERAKLRRTWVSRDVWCNSWLTDSDRQQQVLSSLSHPVTSLLAAGHLTIWQGSISCHVSPDTVTLCFLTFTIAYSRLDDKMQTHSSLTRLMFSNRRLLLGWKWCKIGDVFSLKILESTSYFLFNAKRKLTQCLPFVYCWL